jgi:hypothetical protein
LGSAVDDALRDVDADAAAGLGGVAGAQGGALDERRHWLVG